jgi:hypothetical protein
MRKSPVAQERDRLLALDKVKQEIEIRETTRREKLRNDTESAALDREARAERRFVWLEQEVEKLRAERAKIEARMAALEVARPRRGTG